MSDKADISNLDFFFERTQAVMQDVEASLEGIKTEEDAKIQIINRLLVECLGWAFKDIGAERQHDNGYSDYVLFDDERQCILVEAKRIGELEIDGQVRDRLREL